ncbi:phosphoglycerate mutase [Roridomyces roridus]|uniref:phosphoglycerate mutase (2,3-diphosphoglycerate-independent) n=1 Tax=Roridomyces roridus TaxID=1738132 RepID=A0AAD7BIE7_9AGAR|nr:phosphoglycerate mutase [Roridomyces roridus]
MDTIGKEHAQRKLAAHGVAVGLSEGLMGNSEVGHLNIGAGRIVWQDIVRIDVSIRKREFDKDKTILQSFERAKSGNGRLHFLGSMTRLTLSRDTAPRSAAGYCQDLLDFMAKEKYGALATVVGRYYAMDRDKRWERVKVAVDGLVGGVGEVNTDAVAAIKQSYEKDVTDEFMKPVIVNGDKGRIKDDDTLFFFNYRSDRMREISAVFGLPHKPMEVTIPTNLHITTMSRYNSEYPFAVAFPPQAMTNVLAQWLAAKSKKQAHIAETEKYAHVTFFFNGGVEAQFTDEERHMIASPKVATYDLQPQMAVQAVADKVAEVVKADTHDFVMCNFAPPDMVGHTGKFAAAVQAITATDAAQMLNAETGAPHTAHTCNHLPFIMAIPPRSKDKYGFVQDKEGAEDEAGALCDVAPTVLDLMGLEKPEEMTGRSLLLRK